MRSSSADWSRRRSEPSRLASQKVTAARPRVPTPVNQPGNATNQKSCTARCSRMSRTKRGTCEVGPATASERLRSGWPFALRQCGGAPEAADLRKRQWGSRGLNPGPTDYAVLLRSVDSGVLLRKALVLLKKRPLKVNGGGLLTMVVSCTGCVLGIHGVVRAGSRPSKTGSASASATSRSARRPGWPLRAWPSGVSLSADPTAPSNNSVSWATPSRSN